MPHLPALVSRLSKSTGGTVIEDEEEEITGKATTALWGYALLPSKALMCGLVDYMWRHRGNFRIFVCNKRNWQNTCCRVSGLDPQFFANISASRWKFKNRLDDATSTIITYI